jgi:DNA primase
VKLSKEHRKFLERATLQYAEHLDEAAEVLEARGIDLEHARSSGLGLVSSPPAQHERYRGRLAIPYLTDAGPVNMSFRCIQDHSCKDEGHGKYMKMEGWNANLYGVQSITWADEWIAIAEGELDALVLHQIGIPALGVPGVGNWKDHWLNIFDDFSRIYVFADSDAAGDAMFKKWAARMPTQAIHAKLPKGEDVNSTLVKYGADRIMAGIKK